MAFEQIGIVSRTATLEGILTGASYFWTVNGVAGKPTLLPQALAGPLIIQLQFESTQPGDDNVQLDTANVSAITSFEEVIIVPLGERQRLVAA